IVGGTPIVTGSYLRLPYTVGNGGLYNGVVLQSVGNPNITATISNGMFEEGSGVIAFAIQGIPTAGQASPNGVTFDLGPFYAANPSITEGCKTITVGKEVRAD